MRNEKMRSGRNEKWEITRRSSSVTLSPPTLSPAPDIEQSQSVLHRIGRTASLQRAASSQRRSQRPPSLSPTQWTCSYGSPSPPIGSDIETDFPAARPTVYQPRSIEASQMPLQVDSRPRAFPGVSLAAEEWRGGVTREWRGVTEWREWRSSVCSVTMWRNRIWRNRGVTTCGVTMWRNRVWRNRRNHVA